MGNAQLTMGNAMSNPQDVKVTRDDLATREERQRRQRARSIAIAVTLAVLVGLFYAATIVRLGGNVLNRAL